MILFALTLKFKEVNVNLPTSSNSSFCINDDVNSSCQVPLQWHQLTNEYNIKICYNLKL